MTVTTVRCLLCVSLGILLGSLAAMAAPRPLTDHQLDAVYAAGFDVYVQADVDVAASKPGSVLIQGDQEALQQFMDQGMSVARTGGYRNAVSLDPSGSYMPDLKNLVVNNINISDSALQNATTLMNIFALEGDIAVGVNLNVIVNPVNSAFNVTQNNLNWTNIGLSDAFSTLPSP